MLTRNRRDLIALALLFSAPGLFAACREDKAPPPTKARANPAEIERLAAGARRELKELEPPLATLRAQYATLHQQFDPLPPGLPGFGETRARFYSAAIGVGTLSAKLPWLSGRIDAAVQAGDRSELEALAQDVTGTRHEIRQAERIGQELSQAAQSFKKRAEELRITGKATCE